MLLFLWAKKASRWLARVWTSVPHGVCSNCRACCLDHKWYYSQKVGSASCKPGQVAHCRGRRYRIRVRGRKGVRTSILYTNIKKRAIHTTVLITMWWDAGSNDLLKKRWSPMEWELKENPFGKIQATKK